MRIKQMILDIKKLICHTLAPIQYRERAMRHLFQVLLIGIVFSIFFNFAMSPRKAHAYESRKISERVKYSKSSSVKELEMSLLRHIRLIHRKMDSDALQAFFRKFPRKDGRHDKGEKEDDKKPPCEKPLTPEEIEAQKAAEASKQITNGLAETQKASPLGLVASFTTDGNLVHQAFTYDQALSGILFLKQNQMPSAKKILDFYNSQWKDTAFYTVYNSQAVDGPKVEDAKTLGATAWIGLFSLHYYKMTGDASALELATKIGKWAAQSVPHYDGGLAMGDGLSGIWSSIFSTENNLSYYGLAHGLSKLAASDADKALFESEKVGVENWLKIWGYDAGEGVFERGRGDENNSFDTNSWAILVLGPEKLSTLFGIDMDPANTISSNLVKTTEDLFTVQDDGSFEGDILTAKGFDFSDNFNAQQLSRPGMKWVEGTNHMVVAYQMLANYWTSKNNSIADYYKKRADYFLSRNADNAVRLNGTLSYHYTDSIPRTQIFYDINTWRTPNGPGIGSTAWVYLALNKINPFEL